MNTADTAEWLAGGGAMGELIRAADWSGTPLGARGGWSPSLRVAVGLVVESPLAMGLLWGREWVLLFNDAWRAVVAEGHPSALGQPARGAWAEAWAIGEPAFDAVMRRGESVHLVDQRRVLRRAGRVEEGSFTIVISPVRDEQGDVAGAHVVVRETTEQRERLRDLDALERLQGLSARLAGEEDADGILAEVLEAAIGITEADFGNLQIVDPHSGDLRIVAQRGFAASWVEFWDRVSQGRGACGTALALGERVVVEDVMLDPSFDEAARRVQLEAGVHAVQSTPLLARAGALLGMISTHSRRPGRPSARSLRFIDLLARQAADFLERSVRSAALRRSEALFSDILMTSADGIVLADAEHRIVRFNRGAEAIFGYTAAEVLGKPLDILVPDRFRAVHKDHVAGFAAGPPVARAMGERDVHIVGRRKDGAEFPVDISISKVQVDGDMVMTATIRDVGEERRRAARMRFLANESPAVLYTCAPEPPHAPSFVGANVFEHFGLRSEVLTTEPGAWADRIHPDDAPRVFEQVAQALRRGERCVSEYRLRRADGSYAWVLDELGLSRGDREGELIGFVTDISARKALEALEARERAEEHVLAGVGAVLNPLDIDLSLRHLSQLLSREFGDFCVVFTVDPSGELRRVGVACRDPADAALAERTMTVEPGLPPGHPAALCFREKRPILLDIAPRQIEQFARGPEHLRVLEAAAPRYGLAVPILIGDACVGVVGASSRSRSYDQKDVRLFEEIARRVALFIENARLRGAEQEATQARDRVLGVVAHDLRNPLYAIALQADVLRLSNKSQGSAEIIARSARRMGRIIEDLLDVTEIEAGGLRVRPVRASARAILEEAAELHRPVADARAIGLVVEPVEDFQVWADVSRTQQVLENLIGNALKFTKQGRISLGARRGRSEGLFWVADTGSGIEPGYLPHVFDRFWRPGDRRSGTGLGLSIVQGLVQAQGGRVWVESVPGEGTTFSFTLPLEPDAREGA